MMQPTLRLTFQERIDGIVFQHMGDRRFADGRCDQFNADIAETDEHDRDALIRRYNRLADRASQNITVKLDRCGGSGTTMPR
jgi:hypothetical protein